jgi:hypothetical protein
MKINISFCLLLFIILFHSSCKKDNSGSPGFHDSIPRILSVAEYFNGSEQSVDDYIYDANSRLIKILYNEIYADEHYFDTVTYNGTTITITTYDKNYKLLEMKVYTLNSEMLAIIMTDTITSEQKSLKHSFRHFSLQDLSDNIYGYDNNGYQILQVSTNEYGGIHRFDMTYSEGNIISSIYQYMANDTVIQNGITTFKYFNDKSNTIGNLNMGIPFLGKQNSNLLLSISEQKWSSADTIRTSTSYRYEFDNKNRVSKQYISPQNGDSDDVSYLSFTYR